MELAYPTTRLRLYSFFNLFHQNVINLNYLFIFLITASGRLLFMKNNQMLLFLFTGNFWWQLCITLLWKKHKNVLGAYWSTVNLPILFERPTGISWCQWKCSHLLFTCISITIFTYFATTPSIHTNRATHGLINNNLTLTFNCSSLLT